MLILGTIFMRLSSKISQVKKTKDLLAGLLSLHIIGKSSTFLKNQTIVT